MAPESSFISVQYKNNRVYDCPCLEEGTLIVQKKRELVVACSQDEKYRRVLIVLKVTRVGSKKELIERSIEAVEKERVRTRDDLSDGF